MNHVLQRRAWDGEAYSVGDMFRLRKQKLVGQSTPHADA
jgi:hypothetical protein